MLDCFSAATRCLLLTRRRRPSAAADWSSKKKYAAAASVLTSSFDDHGQSLGCDTSSSSKAAAVDCRSRKPDYERGNDGRRQYVSEGDDSDDDDMATVAEWRELARILDRFSFWLLFGLMTASAIIILLYPKYTGNETGWYASTLDGT
jgi:hypothetical protein